jgi:N-acetylglucosamine transport system permease protein
MKKRDQYLTLGMFLGPAVLLYGVFFCTPMLQAFYYSMFRWRGLSQNKEYVGLDNFRQLTGDPIFWMALKHNFTYLVASVLIIIPLALFFSYVLSRKVRGATSYRAVFLFPNIISIVAVAVLWSFVYNMQFGLLNAFLKVIHLGNLATGWLGEPKFALPAVIATSIWYMLGFYIVLFLAGMQSIPPSFYEAAMIDGANPWQSFRHVTIPLLWEILKLGVIYLIIQTMNVFGLVWVMTEGGPSNHTETMLTYLYRKAFAQSQYGYGTALGVVVFILVMGIALTSIRAMKREVVEY